MIFLMEKEIIILIMVKYTKGMWSIIYSKELGNIYMKMEIIISGNGKMMQKMEKEFYMIKRDILTMKVILLMTNLKGMENII